MKNIFGFFAAIVVVAAVSAFCTWHLVSGRHSGDRINSHAWLHDELKLTAAQQDALKAVEARFEERERPLREQMRQANRDLAVALGTHKALTPEVMAAVEQVHRHMGELQKVSLEHLFEMRAVLTPEQADRLLRLAQQGLEESP